jgi:hypothetical protein
MDVYLVPAGRTRHELYCEAGGQVDADANAPHASLWHRMTRVFYQMLAEGERTERDPAGPPVSRGRARRFLARLLARAVAEQRLLWHLRRADSARLVYPDDLDAGPALEAGRRLLRHDRDKHRRWLVIDGALIVVAAPFALLPGPNVLAYYFIFRTVGHWLSLRGATQGLARTTWTLAASPLLTELRAAITGPAADRAARVAAVARGLALDRLPAFVDRIADRD